METSLNQQISDLVKNIDYSLRVHEAKYVLVASDASKEGKSTFILECAPGLVKVYKRKVLIYDCQSDRDDVLEKGLCPSRSATHQFIRQTTFSGLDYLHSEDIFFLNTLPEAERAASLLSHFNEITKDYDLVLINMKTLKRAEKSTIPSLPVDGAILIRGPKNIEDKLRFLTNELLDREIPILGLVNNEGAK
jgi:hypothetical protein